MRRCRWPGSIIAAGVGVLVLGASLGSSRWTSAFQTEPDQLACERVNGRAGTFTKCSMVEETTPWQRLTTEYTYHALVPRDGEDRVARIGEGREDRTSPSDTGWRTAMTWIGQAAAHPRASLFGANGPEVQTSLAQAVRVAEQRTGERARRAEMERKRRGYVYEIETVSKDQWAEVLVDPATGSVLELDAPGFVSSITNVFDREIQRKDHAALARLEASSMSMADAIDVAQKETGGGAVKAAVRGQHGSTLFEVRVIKNWTMQKVLVNPTTAKVVTVPPSERREGEDYRNGEDYR
jgi:uncharacterized membrane protein YkoI